MLNVRDDPSGLARATGAGRSSLLNSVQLPDSAGMPTRTTLSGGQQQRRALGPALATASRRNALGRKPPSRARSRLREPSPGMNDGRARRPYGDVVGHP